MQGQQLVSAPGNNGKAGGCAAACCRHQRQPSPLLPAAAACSANCWDSADKCESCKNGMGLKDGVCTPCSVANCDYCDDNVDRCASAAAPACTRACACCRKDARPRSHVRMLRCTPSPLPPAAAPRGAARTALAMKTKPTRALPASRAAPTATTARVRRGAGSGAGAAAGLAGRSRPRRHANCVR